MAVPGCLTNLLGSWSGRNTLYVPWLNPPESKSEAAAHVASVVKGKFVTIAYTWADHGEPHEGLLLIGQHPKQGDVTASWTDSWHQGGSVLQLTGDVGADGSVTLRANYPAPPDPDWGWRIVISAQPSGFDVVMTNITPQGEETVAVETHYERRLTSA